MQYVLEQVIGLQGMINYVDARTSWMDDIVKQAQWQGITQVRPPVLPQNSRLLHPPALQIMEPEGVNRHATSSCHDKSMM